MTLLIEQARTKMRRESSGFNGEPPPAPELPQEWPTPLPLDDAAPGPSFPVERLPSWLRQWVTAEAEATQTPPDLAAMMGLSVGSAGIARKIRVQIRKGYTEPTNIYTTTAMLSGERKSAVVADCLEPVQQYERHEIERMAPLIAEAESARRILEQSAKNAETKAAKAEEKDERDRLRHEAKLLAKELAEHVVPESPLLLCDDETPEALGRLLARHGGRMLLASAEGTVFDMAKGRYSETANFDIFLKAHAGDELRVGRISREREHVAFPALCIALAVQPDVIRGLGECATMLLRGLLARFAWSFPRSKVGQRTIAPRPVPTKVKGAYHENMLALWKTEYPVPERQGYAAHWLQFTPTADEVLRGLERWLEPQLAPGEELYHLAGWANKLAGLVARLSGIMHMMEAIGATANWNSPILPETVENAVIIGRDYLLPHAQAAFGIMGADSKVSLAKNVWDSIIRNCAHSAHSAHTPATFSRRDAHNWNRRACPTVEDLDPALRVLEDYGYIRFLDGSGSPGKARKSPQFMVNPAALDAARKKAEERAHCAHCAHSPTEDEPIDEDCDIVTPFDDDPPPR